MHFRASCTFFLNVFGFIIFFKIFNNHDTLMHSSIPMLHTAEKASPPPTWQQHHIITVTILGQLHCTLQPAKPLGSPWLCAGAAPAACPVSVRCRLSAGRGAVPRPGRQSRLRCLLRRVRYLRRRRRRRIISPVSASKAARPARLFETWENEGGRGGGGGRREHTATR